MRKKIIISILFTCVALVVTAHPQTAKADSDVVVFYDSLAKGTDNEGNMDSLLRMLNSLGKRVTIYAWEENPDLSQASEIIVLQNKKDQLTDKWTEKLAESKAKIAYIGANPPTFLANKLQLQTKAITDTSITIKTEAGLAGKPQLVSETNLITSYKGEALGEMDAAENGKAAYGIRAGNYAYTPIFQANNTSEFALMDLLKAVFEIKTTTNQYALITDVNPFVDFDLLKKTADTFYEKGIPFIISAGPVFYNQDFQAAKNYAEILRYVQAKNGTIMMDVPVVTYGDSPPGDLENIIQKSLHFYADHDIAALGVTAELYWNFDKVYGTEGFAPFNTGILLPNQKIIHTTKKNNGSAFEKSPYSVANDFYETTTSGKNFPVDIAVTYSFFQNEKELKAAAKNLANENISDFRYKDHQVKTNKDTIESNAGSLYINNQSVTLDGDLNYIKTNKDKTKKQAGSLEGFFGYQNTFFTIIIVLSLGIIGVLFIFGYRLYMKKYMK
ncbi:DUF2334 domain-containing protein [Listeria innocua]|uniref:DUF2334 domain-containing protein n=1 Tax=Listeria innocua TaxID=1642 RepID=UPI0014251B16|nr:DUF2334 domain-containing protein [Listeria innocua]EAH4448418.1 DUF2334 domain-containing protein [Listeria innocua]EDO1201111.1 DUF2334 domain-containing protein [Listeria innocua]EKO3230487.1 DUF2334 domain-containing protein [Listeria innocua]EKQ5085902.1 DUF2334 domain-containing protein [Listeria innocua]EKQ5092797.1 DUF2334 domain-containing protein [Listeria innocua]